jgi:hypothetical protein
MVLSFPTNPSVGQVYQLWTWDGQKWICTGGGGGNGGNGGGGDIIGNGVIGVPSKTIVFNSSGTYAPSAGISSVMVECVGGGGAGGGVIVNGIGGAGGGGSGAYSRKVLLPSQIGASQTVTIGAGGVGVAGAAGGNGGTTSFGTLVTAGGGSGAQADNNQSGGIGGDGGAPGVGDIAFWGNAGGAGQFPFDGTNFFAICGAGAGSVYGVWGSQIYLSTNNSGSNGADALANTGSGGDGALGVRPTQAYAGGAGGSGYCIVTEYSLTP